MHDIKHAESLYHLALHNIRALRAMLDTESFTDDIFGFQAQQGIEKILKSWLSLRGLTYRKTHDIELLIQQLKNDNQQVPEAFDKLIDLNDFAVQFRYEVFDDEAVNRLELIKQVELCLLHIESLLEK